MKELFTRNDLVVDRVVAGSKAFFQHLSTISLGNRIVPSQIPLLPPSRELKLLDIAGS